MTFACRRATRAALVGQVAGVPALEGTRPAPDLRLAERSNIAPLETADHPAEQKPERQERRGRSERPGEPLLGDLPRHDRGRGKLGVNPHRADPGDQSHPKSRKRDPRAPTVIDAEPSCVSGLPASPPRTGDRCSFQSSKTMIVGAGRRAQRYLTARSSLCYYSRRVLLVRTQGFTPPLAGSCRFFAARIRNLEMCSR